MTNSDRLQEIRERAEAATKGPWSAHTATRYIKDNDPERGILGPNGENAICWIADEFEDSESNDDFIAEARLDIPYLLQLVTEQRAVLDSAVRFIESALIICARSCNPGDGLHVSWGEDICKAARALGPLNALEELRQKNEAKGQT